MSIEPVPSPSGLSSLFSLSSLSSQASAHRSADALLRGPKPTINPFEVTLERLGAAIKMGLYEPGDQLPTERDIAQLMGISRATVREAIRLLVAQGILVVKRGRAGGTFVSQHPPSQALLDLRQRLNTGGATLAEILDHRLIVETGIVELAAERAEAEQLDELQDLVTGMQYTDDYPTYRKLDIRFHLLIAKATQTNRLPAIVAEIHAELTDLLQTAPYSPSQRQHSTQQHQEIVDALREQAGDRARAVMQEHILATNSFLKGLL
jgi:GntR family transcriptional regulator, transcriptional repressor for pyruvate dehydrogenase complex